LTIVYTAMHGVGGDLCCEVLRQAGFENVHPVPAQHQPDPDFPTVPFPNPEEPGALDLAYQLADRVNADLILANDPDADRLAVAIPTAHGWRQLTGDEVGQLLGTQAAKAAALTGRGQLATSIVSSSMLEKIAAAHGVGYRATLTGFKWIARIEGLVFGYEEALGYCCDPEAVRDKDGIGAALAIATLAAKLSTGGLTLGDELDDYARRYGVHATNPLTIRVDDLRQITAVMQLLRNTPPTHLDGVEIIDVVDYSGGGHGLPPTNAIRFATGDGLRVIVRPSGTEPKLKCYLEVVEPVRSTLPAARERAQERAARVREELAALFARA
ncbi:MAG: phospho-sugar mutase, partial [Bowdeniella nasicola]|nr:phospho-sugar mutase [Bowdeniella nasicola]